MPSSTRQATPGPSSTPAESSGGFLSTSNAKKRPGSEDVEDAHARHNKKIKVDGEPLSNLTMNTKDKKKKKKKKKKRVSVVSPEVKLKERLKPISRTASNKPTSVVKMETATDGLVDNTKHMSSSKGKGKTGSNSPISHQVPAPAIFPVTSGSEVSNVILPDSVDHVSEIARLKEQVASQDILLQKHKVHLVQHQQALTCQICLDLMYKPFALAPCGHITCYNCLIRWFTAFQNPNAAGVVNDNANPMPENVDEVQLIVNSAEARRGTYLRRRKTCPVCRAAVLQRPVEMWGIKAMVATLVNSELMDLPASIPSNYTTPGRANSNGDANNDPWRHIFQHNNALNNAMRGPLVQDQANREHMGMYDNEDGGIYRCIDCLHEIWGGVCSGCSRGYPGHERDEDDDDDVDVDDAELDGINYLFRRGLMRHHARQFVQALHDEEIDDEEDQYWDEEDEDHPHVDLHHHPVYPMFLNDEEGMTDSEEEGDNLEDFNPYQRVFLDPPAFGGIARINESSDEDRESEYDGSFIDDNEEEEGEIMDDRPEVIEVSVSSDEERTRPYRLPRTRMQHRRRPLAVNEDEENTVDLDDDEAGNLPVTLIRHSGRRTRMSLGNSTRRHATVLLTDGSRSSGEEPDENEGEEDGEEDGQTEVLSRSRARTRTRVLSDDE